jgi:hypothetical protein
MKKAKKLSLKQKAKKAGVPAQIVYNRMHEGWSEKKALSVPVGKYTKKSTPVLSKEPKKVAYKVEPKKEQASGSRVKIADSTVKIPLPVQKFEKKRNNKQMYVAIAIGIILLLAIAFFTR